MQLFLYSRHTANNQLFALHPPQCTLSRAITANEALASCDGVSSGLSRRRLHRAARALTGILKSNYLQLETKKNDVLGCTARAQPEHTAILRVQKCTSGASEKFLHTAPAPVVFIFFYI